MPAHLLALKVGGSWQSLLFPLASLEEGVTGTNKAREGDLVRPGTKRRELVMSLCEHRKRTTWGRRRRRRRRWGRRSRRKSSKGRRQEEE